MGTSGMGRDMLSLVISNSETATDVRERSEVPRGTARYNQKFPSGEKLSFVIIGAQHAREVCRIGTHISKIVQLRLIVFSYSSGLQLLPHSI